MQYSTFVARDELIHELVLFLVRLIPESAGPRLCSDTRVVCAMQSITAVDEITGEVKTLLSHE